MRALSRARRLFGDGAFVRSSVISALATGSDFIAASSLHWARAPAWLATLLGCVVGGVIAFSLNRTWAFHAQAGHRGVQLLRFLFVWAMSALLNAAGVELVLLAPSFGFGLAWILVRGVVYFGWNYPMLRLFVFRTPRQRVGSST